MLTYGSSSFGYTVNGPLKFKAEGSDTTWYTYDNLGNLISVILPDGTFIEYLIDGQNRRIGKLVNGEFKKGWIYQDQINPVAELDSLGNISARFVYGSKGHVPDYIVRGDSTYYVITDHLGSVRLVVNEATGVVVHEMNYDEFGNQLITSNSKLVTWMPFGYAGGLFDGQTNFVKFGARDYDASVGRWTVKDPIRFLGGENFYEFVSHDPINNIDPSGLKDYILVTASGYGGFKILGGEVGTFFIIDPCTGDVYEFYYAAFGLGPGVGGGVSLEVGTVNLDSPMDLKGLGFAITGFAAAGKGLSFQVTGTFEGGIRGAAVGGVAGAGAGINALLVYSKYNKVYNIDDLPKDIQELIINDN